MDIWIWIFQCSDIVNIVKSVNIAKSVKIDKYVKNVKIGQNVENCKALLYTIFDIFGLTNLKSPVNLSFHFLLVPFGTAEAARSF